MVPDHKHLGSGGAIGFLIPSYMRNASDDAETTTHGCFRKGSESQQFFRDPLSSCYLLSAEARDTFQMGVLPFQYSPIRAAK